MNKENPEFLTTRLLFLLEQTESLKRELAVNKKVAADKANTQEWLNAQFESHLRKLQKRFFESGRETLGHRGLDRREDKKKQLLLHPKSLAGEAPKNEKSKLPTTEKAHFADALQILSLAQKRGPDLNETNFVIDEMKAFTENSSVIAGIPLHSCTTAQIPSYPNKGL